MLILSLLHLRQNQNPQKIPIYIVVQCFPHDNDVCIRLCDECRRSNDSRLSQAWVHSVIYRASLFTDHRISGLPLRAKYKHFRTI